MVVLVLANQSPEFQWIGPLQSLLIKFSPLACIGTLISTIISGFVSPRIGYSADCSWWSIVAIRSLSTWSLFTPASWWNKI